MKLNLSNSNLSKESFIKFLETIAIFKTDTYFYITPDSYKKANYNNSLNTFINDISSCYPKSKQYFINRPFNYKRLCTILRQLSNEFSFTYVTELKYDHSTYAISYKIYTTEGTS